MDEPRIAIAASPRDWAQRLHRYVADHGGAIVRATVLHPSDAIVEEHDVFVVDDSTSFLSRRLIDELHRRGRSVLGVFDPDDPRGKGELLDLGVDEIIARSAAPEQFVLAVTELRTRNRRPVDSELHALVSELTGEPLAAGDGSAAAIDEGPVLPQRTTPDLEPGRITVVSGAGGGVGATEVAIGLAAACGRRGDTTVLVDGDEVAPALAQRLGLPLYPNVRAAIDVLEHRTARLTDTLTPVSGGRFAALPGLSSPRTWSELRPAEAGEVVRALTALRRHVIVNAGARLEDLHAVGAPPRYALSRHLLSLADVVVGVASPTPVGVARLLEWVADVQVVAAARPVHVIFNRAPASGFKRGEVLEELTRSFTPAGIWFVPPDPKVEASAWAGALPPNGPFTKAVAAAADGILPTTAAVGSPRKRRRKARA